MRSLVEWVGFAAIVGAVSYIYAPAGFILAGLLAVFGANFLPARKQDDDSKDAR